MSLLKSESIKEEEQWISRKALLDAMSESEAEEQVRCGSIKVGKKPKVPHQVSVPLDKDGEKQAAGEIQQVVLVWCCPAF